MLIIGVMPMPPAMRTAGTRASGSMKKWPDGAFTLQHIALVHPVMKVP
mgnify:CR=1 FL=1